VAFAKQAVDTGTVQNISLCYRDLNNGPWFAVNEDKIFYPSSLLKVPLFMASFTELDRDPSFLSVNRL
jgi:beta-lactamase class A